MGKSKRIRDDRARQVIETPEKFQKDDAARKAKVTSVILISVIAGLIALTIALVALSSSGIKARSTIIAYTDDFQVTGTMATYIYYNQYNVYYQYFGTQASQYVTPAGVANSIKEVLAICQAAKDKGIVLGEIENRSIERALDSIKETAKNAGMSISDMYGRIGVNASDIENVLRLQYLASKYETQYQNELTDKFGADSSKVESYFEEHKSQLLKGDYVSVNTSKTEWVEELKKATKPEEFKKTFIELFVAENLKNSFNDGNGILAKPVADKLVEAISDWLIYKNTGKAPEGVTVSEDMTVQNLIKKFYEADPATNVTGMGIVTLTDAMYKNYADTAESIDKKIIKADYDAAADKEAFLKTKAEEELKTSILDKSAALPTEEAVEKFEKTLCELVGHVGYGLELENKDASITGTETKITSAMIKVIYEKTYSSAGDDLYGLMAKAATELLNDTKAALKVVTDYTYPTVSQQEAQNTTKGEDTTTSADTTTAGTTTAGSTTTANTAPAEFDKLSEFNKQFFSNAKENDIIVDGDNVYFVVTPGKKDMTPTKNVGHILVSVETETAADTSNEEEVSRVEAANNQAFEAALPKAEDILNAFKNGEQTKAAFEALGNTHTEDSNVFYYNVKKGQMVEEFENWIYDEARKAGDTGIVKTDYGYHVMYFIGDGLEAWKADTVGSMVSEEITNWITELEKSVSVDVDLFIDVLN